MFQCQKPYAPEELVFLNAEGESLELMKTRLEARRALAKVSKKNKRQKQPATVTSEEPASESSQTIIVSENRMEVEEGEITEQVVVVKVEQVEETEEKVTQKRSHSPEVKSEERETKYVVKDEEKEEVKGEEIEKKEESVRGEERGRKEDRERREERSRRKSRERRSSRERRHRERKSGKLDSISDPAYKKAKSEYSVADDPSSTSVYKSLFTSHKDAKSQTKAHWVTYNPFYN